MYEALVRRKIIEAYDFVLKLDSDTYVLPDRLALLVKELRLTGLAPLYMGAPLHHCMCDPSHVGKCEAHQGVHYCSGAVYLLSQRTHYTFTQLECFSFRHPVHEKMLT